MKKLDVLFSDKVAIQIGDINESLEVKLPKSTIARAAMQIGLRELMNFNGEDQTLIGYISVQNLKALN